MITESDLNTLYYFYGEMAALHRWSHWEEKRSELLLMFPTLDLALQKEAEARIMKEAALADIGTEINRRG